MRRIVKIGALFSLFLVLAVPTAVGRYVRSDGFKQWLRNQIIETLEERFNARLELGYLDVQLFGAQVDIYNLQLFSRAYPGREPAIDIDHILLDFSMTHFLAPSISLDNLTLDYPHIHLAEDPNQKFNFSNIFWSQDLPEQEGEFSLPALGIQQLVLNQGMIFYKDQAFVLDSAEGGLATTLQFIPEESKYIGHSSFEHFSMRFNGFSVTDLSLSLDFEALGNQLRVLSLRLDSHEIEARAEGNISDIRAGAYRFQTNLSLDLARLERSPLSSHVQKGRFSLSGTLSNTAGDFLFQGEAYSDAIQLETLPLRRVAARVLIDSQAMTVESLEAQLYDGSVRTHGKLYWKDGASDFQVDASQITIDPLLTALGQEAFPLHGSADFTGQVGWPGLHWEEVSAQGHLSYQGELSPQAPMGSSTLPALSFQGNSSISFRQQEINLTDGVLRTPSSLINYSGSIGFPGAYRLDLDLVSQQSEELFTLIGSSGVPERFLYHDFIEIKGPTRISGTLEGGKDPLSLRGTVRSEQIHLRDELLGDFETRISLSEETFQIDEARLLGPGFGLSTSLRLSLDSTEIPSLEALELQLDQVPIERFLSMTPLAIPMQGQVSGQLHLEEIASGDYRGSGRFSVLQPRVYDEGLDRFSVKVDIEDGEILLQELQGSVQQGTVSGQAAVSWNDQSYRVDLKGDQFPLENLGWLQKEIPAKGPINFTFTGKGNFSDSNFELLLEGPRIVIQESVLENVRLQAEGRGEALDFRLQHGYLGNSFLFEGQLGLVDPYWINATSELKEVSLDPYLQLIPAQDLPDVGGLVSGRLTLTGPLKDPAELSVEVVFPQIDLSLSTYQLKNLNPLRLSYRAGLLTLDQLSLNGEDSELQIGGTIDLGESRSINLELEGTMNLLVMNSFLPSGTMAGQVQLEMVIAGPLSEPRMVGIAELEEGFLDHPQLPTTLFDAEGSLRFTANQVSLDSFSSNTIFGTVNAEGGIFLEGLTATRWQINVFGNGLRLEYPRNLISTIDVDLDLLKSDISELISGAVYVRAAEYNQDISIPEIISLYAQGEIASLPTTAAPEVVLDVTVEAYQSLRATNNLADLVASAELVARGTLQNPVILGTVTIDSGQLFLENNDYEISRGIVNFNDPRRTRPFVNLEGQTEIREFTISVIVQGPLDQLEFTFRSDPPMPTPSIVSLLAIGQTQEEILGFGGERQSEAGTLAVYGAGAVLSKSLGERLENRTSRLFGFEKFSIDPFLFGSERDPGARITLGKQLTRDLSVNYSTDLSSDQQGQIVVFEYKITDWLTAVGTRDQDGSVAIDFKLKQRF